MTNFFKESKLRREKNNIMSVKILLSYLGIILAPVIGLVLIYSNMQGVLYRIQENMVQSSNKEAGIYLNKEFEEAINVSRYISNKYEFIELFNTNKNNEIFFQAVKLVNKMPDYSLFVKMIKSVNILIEGYPYIINYPQIIPNTEIGRATISCLEGNNYKKLIDKAEISNLDGIIKFDGVNGNEYILCIKRFVIGNGKKGVVVLELNKKYITQILKESKNNRESVVCLQDMDGKIITSTDKLYNKKNVNRLNIEMTKNYGRIYSTSSILKLNNWQVETFVPIKEFDMRVADKRNMILVICGVSIIIGIIISIEKWNRTRPVIKRYISYQQTKDDEFEKKDIWKGMDMVISDVQLLECELKDRRSWATEQILKKIFYGMYDGEDKVLKDLKRTNLNYNRFFPCYMFSIDFDYNSTDNIKLWEKIENTLTDFFNKNIENAYEIVHMEIDNWTIIVFEKEENSIKDRKEKMEKLAEWIFQAFHINFYISCSETINGFTNMADEYENLTRIKEYEKYYKIRGPLWIDNLPKHKHIVFGVDLELQLEKTIKNGSNSQLKDIITQIKDTFLNNVSSSKEIRRNTIEIIKGVILRCYENVEWKEFCNIQDKLRNIKTNADIEDIIYESWNYFERKKIDNENLQDTIIRKKLKKLCEENYSDPSFNLIKLADLINENEKKLYRDFKKIFGQSFSSYLEILRISAAQHLLRNGISIQNTAKNVGYSSDYSFRRAFKRVIGMTPRDYQELYKNT